MGANRSLPHVLVLPEDDANRQLANAFRAAIESGRIRQLQVLPPAGGWREVLDQFGSEHVASLDRFPARNMILLIDFDRRTDRLDQAKAVIPARLNHRVFILGVWSEPEELPGGLDSTGGRLAKDCRDGTSKTWGHDLLKHNAVEVDRLRKIVSPILF